MGVPVPRPLQRELVDEPDPRHLHGARLLLQLLPRPAGRPEGRRGDPLPPADEEFNQLHHPSYVDFYEEVLAESTDPAVIEEKYEQQFADGPVVHPPLPHLARLPRRAPVLHVVLGRARAGPRRRGRSGSAATARRVARMGFRAASTLADALEMASGTVGTVAVDHLPAQPAAPARGRADEHRPVSFIRGRRRTTSRRSRAAGAGAGARRCRARPSRTCCPRSRRSSRPTGRRKRPAMAVARGRAEGRARAAVPLRRCAPQVEGLDVLDRIDGPVHLRGQPRLAPRHPADPAARCPTSGGGRTGGGGRGRLLLRHLVARGRLVARSSTPSRSTAAAARWPTTPGEVLADGWILVIFPEGTRSHRRLDGQVPDGRGLPRRRARRPGRPGRAPRHLRRDAARPGLAARRGRRQLTIRFGEPLRAGTRASRCASSRRGSRPRSPTLLDEDRPTWWEARRRVAAGAAPDPVRPGRRPVAPGLGIHRPDQAGPHQPPRLEVKPRYVRRSVGYQPQIFGRNGQMVPAATAASAA